VPARSIDFTTFTWPAITKRLRQMLITGAAASDAHAADDDDDADHNDVVSWCVCMYA